MGEVKGFNFNFNSKNSLDHITLTNNDPVEMIKKYAEERKEEIEELALEEDEVVTDVADGDVADDDFSKRIQEQDPDLKDLNSQIEGVEKLLVDYKNKIDIKPKDFDEMKKQYENAINSTIHYSQHDGYVVSVDKKRQEEIKAEYSEYAKNNGYENMKVMIDFYDSVQTAITELESCKRVLNDQINCKVKLIDYTCKYGLLAENEEYKTSGEVKVFSMLGSRYLMFENNDTDPLQQYTDACNAGYGNYSSANKQIIELYEASRNDASLGQMYQYIYKTEGAEAAGKYLKDLAPYIRQNAGVYEADQFIKSIKNDDDLARNLKELGIGFNDGINSFFQGLSNLADPLNSYTTLDYKKIYILYALTNNEEYSELCYELGLGAGNLTVPLAVGLIIPGGGGAIAGGLLSGASVAGNTTHNCLVNGMDLDSARASGTFAGAVDATTWFLAGKLNKLCKAKFSKSWKEFTVANAGTAGSLGATTFFVQVNEKAQQLLKTGDYYKRYPNDIEAAKKAAYNDAYEALGGDAGFMKKVAFAAGAGGIVGGLSYGKVKADQAAQAVENENVSRYTESAAEAVEDLNAGGAQVSKVPSAGVKSATTEAAALESESVVSEIEAGSVKGDFVISEVQLDTASSILSYLKSMNSSVDTNNEKEE